MDGRMDVYSHYNNGKARFNIFIQMGWLTRCNTPTTQNSGVKWKQFREHIGYYLFIFLYPRRRSQRAKPSIV